MKGYTLGDEPLIVGRTPALPIQDIFEIFRSPDPLQSLRAKLREDAFVGSAVAVASPTLYGAMREWLEDRPLKNPAAPLRLLAYIARMSTRPTPFGFFASIGAVDAGASTTLAIAENGTRRAHARPDMGWLLSLARDVEDDRVGRLALYVTLNPCIIERAGRLHVLNPMNVRREEGAAVSRIEHTPISLKKTPAVEFVIQFLERPVLLREVVAALAQRFGAEREQAEKLVEQLWQAGLFISELRPNPCSEPARTLGRSLARTHPRAGGIRDALARAESLNGAPLQEIGAERYSNVVTTLRAVHEASTALQIDSTHRFSGTLGEAVLADVLHLADTYVRCSRKVSLRSYREAFLRKYEGYDRLVPLLELVHPDFGLGPPAEPELAQEADRASRNEELMDLAARALATRSRVIRLDDETYERVCPPAAFHDAPGQFEVGFQVAAASNAAIDRGEYLVVPSNMMATIGAGRSVGRFASALGDDLSARLTRFAREGCDENIVAEMTYQAPTLRGLNVAQRPNPYAYEVPIGVMHGGATVIPPSDILVGLRGDRFYLYSKRLNRAITVRESHVFNTTLGAPDICRFLSFVERDGTRTFVGFDWGHAARLPVIPRLMHGRVVLSPMTWRAPKTLFEGRVCDIAPAVAAWREQWNLPQFAYFRDNDHWLPVDFASDIALEMLRDQLKRFTEDSLQFCEVLPGEEEVWLTSEGGGNGYVTEFVASIAAVRQKSEPVVSMTPVDERMRRFGPGSDWLYVKLYCGAGLQDAVIAQHVGPLIGALHAAGAIDRAFFVRYADPDAHLRVRMRRPPTTAAGSLFDRVSSLCGELMTGEKIERYTFDTYERELERYGGETNIEDVEALFTEDSTRCLSAITAGTRTQHRKMIDALLSMRWLLEGMLEQSELGLYLEHRGRPARKLSSEDWTIAKAVRTEYAGGPLQRPAIFQRLRDRLADRDATRYALLDSLLHMHCNRLGLERPVEIRVMEILWHVCSGVLAQRAAKPTLV